VIQALGYDFRIALRRLRATPLFTAFAVLSLAFGVGVTTIAYSVVEAMFFRTLAVHEPHRLVFLLAPGNARLRSYSVISRPDFDDLRVSVQSFDGFAASQTLNLSVVSPSTTELAQAEAVNGDYFLTLGIQPAVGRTILPTDDEGASAVAVIGHDLWRGRFASNPGIIGQTVRIGGVPFEIIGVAPRSFRGIATDFFFAASATRVWVPLSTSNRFVPAARVSAPSARAGAKPLPTREQRELTMIGRLRSGVRVESAAAELSRVGTALDLSYPITVPYSATRTIARRGWTARTVVDVSTDATEALRRVGLVVAGLVWLVLVVACTNLANLVLARGTTRRHEFAVRRALGAGRWRLVRELLCESVLIGFAGGAAAYVLMRILLAGLKIDLPVSRASMMSVEPVVDQGTLLVAAGALLVSLVVFGLEPAVQLTRTGNVNRDLSEGAGGLGIANTKRQRLLVRWQVAISTGFFILASLSVRYVIAEMRHDSGIQIDRLAIATLNFSAQGWDETRARRAIDRILVESRKHHEIQSLAVSTGLPLGTYAPQLRLSTPDKPITPRGAFPDASLVASTPGIHRTLGVPLLRGRTFDDRDAAGSTAVIVISETAAREVFGSSDVVGRDLLMQVVGRGPERPPQTATIIGIAGDTDTSYSSSHRSGIVYAPIAQRFDPSITVTAHASGSTGAAIGALRTAIRQADPDVAVEALADGRVMLSGPYVLLRFLGVSSFSLGLLTLVLAMVGLYGVQSHGVAHRTREIGVRMSFGATAAQIKSMVLKDGYRPVFEGIAIGVFIGLSGRAIIRAYLDAKIGILDPWMLAVVPIPLMLAAFFACYLPARRAASVDPTVALRHL
jgi:putative ABC transport system permease protein